jgi:hypothetical protein
VDAYASGLGSQGPSCTTGALDGCLTIGSGLHLGFCILAMIATAGCVRTEGRNTDCKWPAENPLRDATPAHLSADAEFAEDLAIRYADIHHGLRTPGYVSGEVYAAARDKCMYSLFEEIARQHGVSAKRVAGSLGSNRGMMDLAINLSFGLFYLVLTLLFAHLVWRKYPIADHGWIPGAVMALFVSLAMTLGGSMLGEVWAGLVETFRIGNGHMSYRTFRLWWPRHRTEVFLVWLVTSWATTAIAGVRSARQPWGQKNRNSSLASESNKS